MVAFNPRPTERRCRPLVLSSAQSGADVLCIKHGGGKRCMVAGCTKLVRKNNRCTKHASEASSNAAAAPSPSPPPPPPPVPASATAMNVAKTKAAVAATAAVLTAATTTEAVPVAPPPAARRRPAPPPSCRRIAEPGPPSPPEQIETQAKSKGGGLLEQLEAQAGVNGVLLPSVSSMAREPSPIFCPGNGGPLGSLSSLRPPVAAFDDRVASAAGPMHGVIRWVPDCSLSNGNSFASPGNDARFRVPLPGISSLGSSLFGVDQRSGTREGPMSVGQLAPHSSSAAPLLLSGAGLHRHLSPPGGSTAAARENGRPDIANNKHNNNLLARPLEEMVGTSSTRGLPVADRPLPYGGGRYSEGGAIERSPSLSPLPPSLLLQPPPPFPPSYLPAASSSSWDTSGGKRVFAWSGDADTGGSRPALPCDERGGMISPSGPSSYSWEAGQLTSTAEIARSPAGATIPSSAGALFAGSSPGQANASGGGATSSASSSPSVAPEASSGPVAASRSMPAVPQTPAAERPPKPSGCCGGENGGRKASHGPAASSSTARAVAASKARSCSTSPPLEQTSSFISLSVSGMKCMENCGQTVQQALREIPGVQSVTIHFPTRTASVKVRKDKG